MRIDPHVLTVLGLSPDPDDDEIARRFRGMLGKDPDATTDAAMWARFLEAIETARTLRGDRPRGDRAELSHYTVAWAIVSRGKADEDRFGMETWDRELGVGFTESDDILRGFVHDDIAQLLAGAGLYALL